MIVKPHPLGNIYRASKQIKVGSRRKGAGEVILRCKGRVCARAHSENEVAHLDVRRHRARRAYSDYIFNAKKREKLIAVNSNRGHTHTACHDRNALSLVFTGVSLYSSDIVEKHGLFKEIFCHEFCAQRVARHKHGLCNVVGGRIYMRRGI